MVTEDTVVATAVSAKGVAETPPPSSEPETAATPAPQTEPEAKPETEAKPPAVRDLSGWTAEEKAALLDSDPDLKSLRARDMEAERRRAENAATTRERSRTVEAYEKGRTLATLVTHAQKAVETGALDVDAFNDALEGHLQAGHLATARQIFSIVRSTLPATANLTPQQTNDLLLAQEAIEAGHRAEGLGLAMEVVQQARLEAMLPAEKSKWQMAEAKSRKAEIDAGIKLGLEKHGISEAKNGDRPTEAGGVTTGRPTPAQYAMATMEQRAEWRKAGVEPLVS